MEDPGFVLIPMVDDKFIRWLNKPIEVALEEYRGQTESDSSGTVD